MFFRIFVLFALVECSSFAADALQLAAQFSLEGQWMRSSLCLLLYAIGLIATWKFLEWIEDSMVVPDKSQILLIFTGVNVVFILIYGMLGDTVEMLRCCAGVVTMLFLLLIDRLPD